MTIEISHHLDASVADENGDFDQAYYDYCIFHFIENEITLLGRCYNNCEEVSFVNFVRDGKYVEISREDLSTPLFKLAIHYLEKNGKKTFKVLFSDSTNGYELIS